jgi:hypothetical protein
VYGNNCILIATIGTTVPPSNTIILPSQFNTAPAVGIKIMTFDGCERFEIFNCSVLPPTPTPTMTHTPTPTPTPTPTGIMLNNYLVTQCGGIGVEIISAPSLSGYYLGNDGNCWQPLYLSSDPPTISYVNTYNNCLECLGITQTPTPTQTITPTISLTPTNTITPTQTPTQTITPTISLTPTNTITPTLTPTLTKTPTPICNYLFISGATENCGTYTTFLYPSIIVDGYVSFTGVTNCGNIDEWGIEYNSGSTQWEAYLSGNGPISVLPSTSDCPIGVWIPSGTSIGEVFSSNCIPCPTPTPTNTITPTITLTPTNTVTPTPTPTLPLFLGSLIPCSTPGGSVTNEMYLPIAYLPYTIGPFGGWYATTVIDSIGNCYYVVGQSSPGSLPQLTWGGTNTLSWRNYFGQGQYSGCTQCVSTPTNTPTSTVTPTITPSTSSKTPAPTYFCTRINVTTPSNISWVDYNNTPQTQFFNTGIQDLLCTQSGSITSNNGPSSFSITSLGSACVTNTTCFV